VFFFRHISGEIAAEWQENDPDEDGEGKLDELMTIVEVERNETAFQFICRQHVRHYYCS